MGCYFDLCQMTGYDTVEKGKDYSVTFTLDPQKWDSFKLSKDIEKKNWKFVKYLNSNQDESAAYKAVTDKHGGIFLWVIKPFKVPIPYAEYVAYIGKSDGNLKRSITNFMKNVTKWSGALSEILFEDYSSNLYLAYYKCDDNTYNTELLNRLVEAIQPPIQEIPIEIEDSMEMEAF